MGVTRRPALRPVPEYPMHRIPFRTMRCHNIWPISSNVNPNCPVRHNRREFPVLMCLRYLHRHNLSRHRRRQRQHLCRRCPRIRECRDNRIHGEATHGCPCQRRPRGPSKAHRLKTRSSHRGATIPIRECQGSKAPGQKDRTRILTWTTMKEKKAFSESSSENKPNQCAV